MKDEALKLALEALEDIAENATTAYYDDWCGAEAEKALVAIKAALAQPVQPERLPLTDEAKAVIAAARVAMDASFETENRELDISIPAHLATALSLRLDEFAKKQGMWGGGFQAKRQMAADKLQEPFGWYSAQEDEFMTGKIRKEHERLNSYTHINGKFDLPLYTTPPEREWVSLTDAEIDYAAHYCVKSGQSVNAAIRAIEAKLKEKNNG